MKFSKRSADVYVPDGAPIERALARTTHLAVGAHQDDLEIMAYPGIMVCYRNPRKWFTGVVVTNGAGSPRSGAYEAVGDKEMRAVRRREQRSAARIGKYSAIIQLDYPSAQVKDAKNKQVSTDLAEIFRAARPEMVYLHNLADKHDTHVATALRAIEALRSIEKSRMPRRVVGCEVWRDLDWLCDEDKVALPASNHPELAIRLLRVFDSQIAGGKRYDLATTGRRLSNATYRASHATDAERALVYAVDLTELVKKRKLSPVEYMGRFIERFKADVRTRIARMVS
ncbi:MAG: GlcNAc-PI de-N-acetylase [Planctomycetes bacterium RBG_16_59_8]|nr:MAG: GlcNAc-PI de-N-acetylase [Planctomycetes bacterium RBG_16_59_8]